MASRGRGGLGLVSSLMEQDGSVESGSVGRSLHGCALVVISNHEAR